VEKIKNVCIPEDWILITLDVESMYTNIGHAKGLRAVREAFGCSNTLTDAVMELHEITLKGNDFLFNGEWYLQNTGTWMGRDWAPRYVDIYMAKFEKEVHLKCPLQPHTYYRYLDDIFIMWTHGEDSFMDYLNNLNDHEPPIRFKYVMQKERIDFLDTTIFKNPLDNSQLFTKAFKPTDTHQCTQSPFSSENNNRLKRDRGPKPSKSPWLLGRNFWPPKIKSRNLGRKALGKKSGPKALKAKTGKFIQETEGGFPQRGKKEKPGGGESQNGAKPRGPWEKKTRSLHGGGAKPGKHPGGVYP